jgi:hypothetical protein
MRCLNGNVLKRSNNYLQVSNVKDAVAVEYVRDGWRTLLQHVVGKGFGEEL